MDIDTLILIFIVVAVVAFVGVECYSLAQTHAVRLAQVIGMSFWRVLNPAVRQPGMLVGAKVESKPAEAMSMTVQKAPGQGHLDKVIKKPAKFQRSQGEHRAMQNSAKFQHSKGKCSKMQALPEGDDQGHVDSSEAATMEEAAGLGGDYYVPCPASSSAAGTPDLRGVAVAAVLEAAWEETGHKGFYLDLFSGKKKLVTQELRKQGVHAVAFDTLLGPEFDLCNQDVKAAIINYIKNGKILGIACASPCGSWSAARHGTPSSGCPPPLRGRGLEEIYGLPGLSARDQTRVIIGNATMRATADYVKEMIVAKRPVVVENGITSMLWCSVQQMGS